MRAALLAAIVLLSGCQPTFAATLQVAANRSGQTVQISWDSNLPVGSIMELEVFQSEAFDQALTHNLADQFPYLLKVMIIEGQTAKPLTQSIAGWPAGTGVATLTFSPSAGQPADVQRAVGVNGERLAGSQVLADSGGVPHLVGTAQFEIP